MSEGGSVKGSRAHIYVPPLLCAIRYSAVALSSLMVRAGRCSSEGISRVKQRGKSTHSLQNTCGYLCFCPCYDLLGLITVYW